MSSLPVVRQRVFVSNTRCNSGAPGISGSLTVFGVQTLEIGACMCAGAGEEDGIDGALGGRAICAATDGATDDGSDLSALGA